MKNIYLTLFCAVLSFTLLTNCNSEAPTNNVSFVTNYPIFDYKPVLAIPLGQSYDPSLVKASEDGIPLEITNIGADNIKINTVGVYNVKFTATNSDGYSNSVIQQVVVHNPSIVGTDVSGNIRDKNNNSRKGVISLVEGTTSIFYCTDFAYSKAFPMYFQMNGDIISEIPQEYPNDQTSVDLTYNPSTKIFTIKVNPDKFSYVFEYYQ